MAAVVQPPERRMSPGLRKFVGLCLPPSLVSALDGALTLAGQPAEYWQAFDATGRPDAAPVYEVSPTFHYLLATHPLAFAAGGAAEIAVLVGLILLLPRPLALTLSLAAVIGHAWGSTTWLADYPFG